MTGNLEQEETDAIRELAGDVAQMQPNEVALRDFHQPRRLSAARVRRISKKICASFQEVSSRMRPLLRQPTSLHLGDVTEVNASEVVEGLDTLFVMQCFRCAGELGWLVWDSGFAAAAAEAILTGSFEGEVEPRKLSSAELCIIGDLLDQITAPIAKAFGFELEPIRAVQNRADLAELTLPPDRVEPRLRVHMQLDAIGGKSDLCLYLGGFSPEPDSDLEADSLPEHLNKVDLSLQAYLGSIDIPLTGLLSLEVGDVIPLGLDEGSPVQLYVEDRVCATAHLGKVGKTLAVRIADLDPRSGDIEQPNEL